MINARISQGSVHRVAIVRTGMLWPSLIRWLVILIGGSSLEVGARSAPVGGAEAGSMYAQGHRRLVEIRGIVPNRRSGWAGVSQCKERLRATSQLGSGASGGGFGLARGEAQVVPVSRGRPVSQARGRRGERGGPGQPAGSCVRLTDVEVSSLQLCCRPKAWFHGATDATPRPPIISRMASPWHP